MADPIKSDEIEDVLSSIRRLVTEHQPYGEAAGSDDPGAAPDKLVLTPALRVTDPEDPWVPIAARDDLSDEAAELPRGDGVDWAEEMWGDETSGADPDFDPLLQADIWEASEAEADQEPEIAQEPAAAAEEAMEPDESLFLPSDEAEEAVGDIIEAEDIAPLAEDHSDSSEADPAMAEGSDEDTPLSFIRSPRSVVEFEPEEGHVAVPDEEPPFATLELAESRAAQKAVSEVFSEISADPATDEAEDEADAIDAATDEPAVEADPEPEPDGFADDVADAPIHLAESAPDTAPEMPDAAGGNVESEETVVDLGESPFSFPDDDVSFVDEAALREIISDVVREELQGEMGKRITRNIRKLVRREIRIALATDELEE